MELQEELNKAKQYFDQNGGAFGGDREVNDLLHRYSKLLNEYESTKFMINPIDFNDTEFTDILDEFNFKAEAIAETRHDLEHYLDYFKLDNGEDVRDEDTMAQWWNEHEEEILANIDEAMDEINQNVRNNFQELDFELQEGRVGGLQDSIEKHEEARNQFMDDLAELEHILNSSRNLLDRFDERKNSIKLEKDEGISLHNKPEFDDHSAIHFDFDFDIRLEDNGKLDNHLVYLGDETTSLSVDTVDGQVVVTFDHEGSKKALKLTDNQDLKPDIWYNIKVSDTGSRMWLEVNCQGKVVNGKYDLSYCPSPSRGDSSEDKPGSQTGLEIPGEARKWQMDKNKTKVIFGARNNLLDRDDSDGSGFDGSLKNPIFNGYSLGLWKTGEQNLNPDSDHNVDDSEKLSRQCYKPRTGKNNISELFGALDGEKDATCFCLTGDQSYVTLPYRADKNEHRKYFEEPLEFLYKTKFMGTVLKFQI